MDCGFQWVSVLILFEKRLIPVRCTGGSTSIFARTNSQNFEGYWMDKSPIQSEKP